MRTKFQCAKKVPKHALRLPGSQLTDVREAPSKKAPTKVRGGSRWKRAKYVSYVHGRTPGRLRR